jgi:hypothetical protein
MYAVERESIRENRTDAPSANEEANRRQTERRTHESKGYAYISMVGWMDRREKKRRQDDDYNPW